MKNSYTKIDNENFNNLKWHPPEMEEDVNIIIRMSKFNV
jgi:uncharacterized protein (UPF0248 family)